MKRFLWWNQNTCIFLVSFIFYSIPKVSKSTGTHWFHVLHSEIQVQWEITPNFKHHHSDWCLRSWCCFSHWNHLGLHLIRFGTRRSGISLRSNCSNACRQIENTFTKQNMPKQMSEHYQLTITIMTISDKHNPMRYHDHPSPRRISPLSPFNIRFVDNNRNP